MGELAEKIAADKERVAELAARVAATKQTLEAASNKATELGAEDIVRDLGRVEHELAQAESGRAVLEGSLEKARWQLTAAIHGIGPSGPTGEGRDTGQSEDGTQGGDGERLVEFQPGDPDVLPPHERFGKGPTGEELMGQDPNLSPFQKEHENADADKRMNPFSRGARSAARNVEDFKQSLDAITNPAFKDMQSGWKPPANNTYPTVGVADSVPTVSAPPPAHAELQNPVGTLVVVAVLVSDWAARGIRKWKGRS